MKIIPSSEVHALKVAILRHLLREPEASDTIEGIAGWWLLQERIEHTIVLVRAALDELVQEGLVQWMPNGDGRVLFHLNRERAAMIKRLLREGVPRDHALRHPVDLPAPAVPAVRQPGTTPRTTSHSSEAYGNHPRKPNGSE